MHAAAAVRARLGSSSATSTTAFDEVVAEHPPQRPVDSTGGAHGQHRFPLAKTLSVQARGITPWTSDGSKLKKVATTTSPATAPIAADRLAK